MLLSPPTTFVVFSGDEDISFVLASLRMQGFDVVLVVPDEQLALSGAAANVCAIYIWQPESMGRAFAPMPSEGKSSVQNSTNFTNASLSVPNIHPTVLGCISLNTSPDPPHCGTSQSLPPADFMLDSDEDMHLVRPSKRQRIGSTSHPETIRATGTAGSLLDGTNKERSDVSRTLKRPRNERIVSVTNSRAGASAVKDVAGGLARKSPATPDVLETVQSHERQSKNRDQECQKATAGESVKGPSASSNVQCNQEDYDSESQETDTEGSGTDTEGSETASNAGSSDIGTRVRLPAVSAI
jgi:hypothetical protein